MTGTPCIIAPWTAKIAVFLHTLVITILTIAEIVRTTFDETMGRHARLLRRRTGFLPPSASVVHADIGAPPARITDNRKVDLDVSLSARGAEPGKQHRRMCCRTEAGKGSRISKSLRVTLQEASGGPVPT